MIDDFDFTDIEIPDIGLSLPFDDDEIEVGEYWRSKMAEYKKSDFYEEIANEVIDAIPSLHFIRDLGLRVAYRTSSQAKSKGSNQVNADCEKVTDKNKMYVGYDFVITVYEPNVKDWDINRIKVLMWHELLHIGANNTDSGVSTYIVPHDFEDFFAIHSKFGIDWSFNENLPDICEV